MTLNVKDVREQMPNFNSYKDWHRKGQILGIAIHHSATANKVTGAPVGNAAAFFDYHVNTRGWTQPEVGDAYPSREMLETLFAEGVPVTIGSDAHSLERVGDGVARAMGVLHDIGYRELTVFRNRAARTIPLVREKIAQGVDHD